MVRPKSNGSASVKGSSATRRFSMMNLALRGIEADFGPENADSFHRAAVEAAYFLR